MTFGIEVKVTFGDQVPRFRNNPVISRVFDVKPRMADV
jgi:hypothetical protein